MTATNHAITGLAIAVAIHQPALALPLAFLAHFVMDAIPHSNLTMKEIYADMAAAAVLVLVLILLLSGSFSTWLMFGCAFLCASPDLVWGWRYYKHKDLKKLLTAKPISWFSRMHQKIQWSETRAGIKVEAIWLCLILAFILLRYYSVISAPK